jgi:hypothetical protein
VPERIRHDIGCRFGEHARLKHVVAVIQISPGDLVGRAHRVLDFHHVVVAHEPLRAVGAEVVRAGGIVGWPVGKGIEIHEPQRDGVEAIQRDHVSRKWPARRAGGCRGIVDDDQIPAGVERLREIAAPLQLRGNGQDARAASFAP